MDDHSRLIKGARFFMNESTECLKKVFEVALASRGTPQKFYTDNITSQMTSVWRIFKELKRNWQQ